MSNPFSDAIKLGVPPAPLSKVNPLTAAIEAGDNNPLTQAISDANKPAPVDYAEAARAAGEVAGSFEVQHPKLNIVRNFVLDQMEGVGKALLWNITHPIPKEGHGDSQEAIQAATQKMITDMQAMTPHDVQKMQEGAAFIMSFGVGGAGAGIARAGGSRYLGKAGSFLAGEFLGGSVYGGVRPLDEDESRLQAVLGEGASFAALGGGISGAFHLAGMAGTALKRYAVLMPRAKRIEAFRIIREGFERVDDQLHAAGTSLDALPDDAKAAITTPIIRQAIEEVDPAAILDLDQAVVKEANRSIEPNARFDPTNKLNIEPPPGERELDLPDQKFEELLQQSKPLEVPAATESSGAPAGFTQATSERGPAPPLTKKPRAPLRDQNLEPPEGPIFEGFDWPKAEELKIMGNTALRDLRMRLEDAHGRFMKAWDDGTLTPQQADERQQDIMGTITKLDEWIRRRDAPTGTLDATGDFREISRLERMRGFGTHLNIDPLVPDAEWQEFVASLKKHGYDLSESGPGHVTGEAPMSWEAFFKRATQLDGQIPESVRQALRDIGYEKVRIADPFRTSKIITYDLEERLPSEIMSATPTAMKVNEDGSVTVRGFRGVEGEQDVTKAGIQGFSYIAQDAQTASLFFGSKGKPGRIARLEVTFKNPKIVEDWIEVVPAKQKYVSEYRQLHRKASKAGFFGTGESLTDKEHLRYELMNELVMNQPRALRKLADQGYDGLIVLQGIGGDAEFVALNKDNVKMLKEITGSEVVDPAEFNAIASRTAKEVGVGGPSLNLPIKAGHLATDFDTFVISRMQKGMNLNDAINEGVDQLIRYELIHPNFRNVVIKAWHKYADFLGDMLPEMIEKRQLPYKSDINRALEDIAAKQRKDVTAGHVAQDMLDPQSVTLPVPPPKGFEPTGIGEVAPGAEGEVQRLALADEAISDAVRRIEPLEISTPEVRSEGTLVQELIGDPIEPGRGSARVADILSKALEKPPTAAEAQAVLELSHPQPWEVALDRKVSPREAKYVKDTLTDALTREVAPIEIEASEQVRATWVQDVVDGITAPPLNGHEIAVRLDDKALNSIAEKISELGRRGVIMPGLMGRIAFGGAGITLETIAYDDDTPPAVSAGLHALGSFMILAAAHPLIKELAVRTKWVRSLIEQYNPTYLMSSKGKEAFRQAVENMTSTRAFAHGQFQIIEKMFESVDAKRSLMFVLDEGSSAPEWHLLTPKQQALAVNLHQLNLRLGILLKGSGIINEYVENYVRHLLPPESFQRWKVNGYRTLQTGGAFTQKRHILTLRDLETWAKNEGVAGPIMDPAYVHQHHLIEAYRSIGNARLRTALEGLGLIDKAPASPFTVIKDGWRQLRIAGMGDKVAPDEVAHALENMSTPGATVEWLNGFDTIKSWWMRSVMFWFWEHGLNVMRSLPAVALDPTGIRQAWRAVKHNDPSFKEAAGWGVDFFSRPDYGARSAQNFQELLKKVSKVSPMLGAPILKGLSWITNKNDKILWDNIVPALQHFAWQTEMAKWTDRTKGKFLKGTIEYTTAARKAADYANIVAGRIPQELTDPKLAQGMRLLLFSPQWTMSRIALTAHAAGEVSNALNATSAAEIGAAIKGGTYLPFKVRQLATAVAMTWLISKTLSGKDPEFNPKTNKFYARTGWRNAQGREMGLDLAGWWQGDLQMFSNTWGYFENRLNPALKIAQETVTGRDFAGRSMTGMERIGNVLQSFGPPTELAGYTAREIQGAIPGGAPRVSAGERASRLSGVLATGNVATLPRPMDVAIAKMSKRLLRIQHIPANDDLVYELSRILRANVLAGHDMIDDRVVNYLAYRRRSHQVNAPGSTTAEYLWQQARRVLSDF